MAKICLKWIEIVDLFSCLFQQDCLGKKAYFDSFIGPTGPEIIIIDGASEKWKNALLLDAIVCSHQRRTNASAKRSFDQHESLRRIIEFVARRSVGTRNEDTELFLIDLNPPWTSFESFRIYMESFKHSKQPTTDKSRKFVHCICSSYATTTLPLLLTEVVNRTWKLATLSKNHLSPIKPLPLLASSLLSSASSSSSSLPSSSSSTNSSVLMSLPSYLSPTPISSFPRDTAIAFALPPLLPSFFVPSTEFDSLINASLLDPDRDFCRIFGVDASAVQPQSTWTPHGQQDINTHTDHTRIIVTDITCTELSRASNEPHSTVHIIPTTSQSCDNEDSQLETTFKREKRCRGNDSAIFSGPSVNSASRCHIEETFPNSIALRDIEKEQRVCCMEIKLATEQMLDVMQHEVVSRLSVLEKKLKSLEDLMKSLSTVRSP